MSRLSGSSGMDRKLEKATRSESARPRATGKKEEESFARETHSPMGLGQVREEMTQVAQGWRKTSPTHVRHVITRISSAKICEKRPWARFVG